MMDNVRKMVECWKQTKSVESLLALNITISDIQKARADIQAWEAPERREAFKILREIMIALSSFTQRLRHEKESLGLLFRQAEVREAACLAYNRQTRIQSKRKS